MNLSEKAIFWIMVSNVVSIYCKGEMTMNEKNVLAIFGSPHAQMG